MSLNGAFQIGRTAITASQAALQVAGNNMANAATEGYHRQSVHLSPARGQVIGNGQYVGRGVRLDGIRREIDGALQARLRDAVAAEHGARMDQRFLGSIETLQSELTDRDLSSKLSDLFNGFSEVANSPGDPAIRSVVIQQGQTLATHLNRVRSEYATIRTEIDQTLGDTIKKADALLDQIADINSQIVTSEQGSGQNNSLRDQRDILIDELSEYTEVTVIEQNAGSVDILIGSLPVVLGTDSRGIELRKASAGSGVGLTVRIKADGSLLDVDSGRIGGLLRQRSGTVDDVMEKLDTFSSQLIFQVNRLHSQGQGLDGFESVTGTQRVEDATVPLNDADARLPYRIENGSFFLHLTHQNSDTRTTMRIDIDADVMSLNDVVAAINSGVPGANASVGLDNRLQFDATEGYELTFSDDTGGALAVLGINTFFSGEDAADIAVNDVLLNDPGKLAAGSGHVVGSNVNALALSALQDSSVDVLGGRSLRGYWQGAVNELAVKAEAANTAVGSTGLVRESLSAQMQAVSGVSLDEEAINLLSYQRQFQAAARFISVIDETLQILLSLA